MPARMQVAPRLCHSLPRLTRCGQRRCRRRHFHRAVFGAQSVTWVPTPAGITGFDAFYNFADMMSPLGNAPAEACADYCISLFSDLTRYVTMQNLMHDGGFSTTGISAEIVDVMTKAAGVSGE